jgi:riboflavin biosynthesis pyrimidine reductase
VTPLELLYEPVGLPAFALPPELALLYPGTLGLPEDALYVNFVETLDGVVALPDIPRSNRVISDDSEADLFVMALLRACADAVVVGTGTARTHPNNKWTAEAAFPTLAAELVELRRDLGLRPRPEVVVLSGRADLAGAVAELRDGGCRRILCEGGPTLFGALLTAGLVDELFLTISPLLAGSGLSLVEAFELLPARRVAGTLAGVRRHGSHLFLRYRLTR